MGYDRYGTRSTRGSADGETPSPLTATRPFRPETPRRKAVPPPPVQPAGGPLVQRYTIVPDGKLSDGKKMVVAPDTKHAYVKDANYAAAKAALDDNENAKVTLSKGAAKAVSTQPNTAYSEIIPVLKPDTVSDQESRLQAYQAIAGVIKNPHSFSPSVTKLDKFAKAEAAEARALPSLPNDCRKAAEELQEEVSTVAQDDPAAGSNYYFSQEEGIQGTLKAALKAWNFHFASVIMKDEGEDNTDNMTFETAADGFESQVKNKLMEKLAENGGLDDWVQMAGFLLEGLRGKSLGFFEMYGTEKTAQTFQFTTWHKLIGAMLDQGSINVEQTAHDIVSEGNAVLEGISGELDLLSQKLAKAEEDKEEPLTVEEKLAITRAFLSSWEPLNPVESNDDVQDEDDVKDEDDGKESASEAVSEDASSSSSELSPLQLQMIMHIVGQAVETHRGKLVELVETLIAALEERKEELAPLAVEDETYAALVKSVTKLQSDLEHLARWVTGFKIGEDARTPQEIMESLEYIRGVIVGEMDNFKEKLAKERAALAAS